MNLKNINLNNVLMWIIIFIMLMIMLLETSLFYQLQTTLPEGVYDESTLPLCDKHFVGGKEVKNVALEATKQVSKALSKGTFVGEEFAIMEEAKLHINCLKEKIIPQPTQCKQLYTNLESLGEVYFTSKKDLQILHFSLRQENLNKELSFVKQDILPSPEFFNLIKNNQFNPSTGNLGLLDLKNLELMRLKTLYQMFYRKQTCAFFDEAIPQILLYYANPDDIPYLYTIPSNRVCGDLVRMVNGSITHFIELKLTTNFNHYRASEFSAVFDKIAYIEARKQLLVYMSESVSNREMIINFLANLKEKQIDCLLFNGDKLNLVEVIRTSCKNLNKFLEEPENIQKYIKQFNESINMIDTLIKNR